MLYENSKNPDEIRKNRIGYYFKLAKEFIKIDDLDIKRARFLKRFGFSDIDALHITLAEKSKADYFITCDIDIIKRYKKYRDLVKINVVGLTEFIGLEVK